MNSLRHLLTWLLLVTLTLTAQAGWLKPDVDLTNYDQPLQEQIVNRIKTKVFARLGEGKNTHDRYFIIPFAYQNEANDPEFSHSFMTVIRVLADNQQAKLLPGLRTRTYKNREFQAFTISWLPHDFLTNPHLCVFDGVGAILDPAKNQCPTSIGKDFNLPETLKLAVNVKNAVGMWGPYEIKEAGFDLAIKRLNLLNKGHIRYRADDRLTRKSRPPVAINCFHAIASIDKPFPDGGLFGTGFMMWGLNGTKRVLIEYNARAREHHALLEPIDEDKDLYGFVYAPTRNGHGLYNPFRNASAYHK